MPLCSFEASGTVAKGLTFSKGWKGVAYARMHKVPKNPQTSGQTEQRDKFTNAVADWHLQDEETKADWGVAAAATGKALSGFNYYVQQYIDQGGTPVIPS